jgi:SAM-dependent methyltransferase
MPAVDTYHVIAKYYDGAYAAKQDLVDLPFYLELAEQYGGPMLEIACGTGRVTLPIARKGIEICGVDNSAPMLQVLNQNLAGETPEAQQRVTVREGDMRSFRLDKKFALVIIPFRPMQHMFTVEDQVAALKTAAAHLTDDGILAFDVFYPKFEMIWTQVGEEVQEMEWSSSADPTKIVRRFFRKAPSTKSTRFLSSLLSSAPSSRACSSWKRPKPFGCATTPIRTCERYSF